VSNCDVKTEPGCSVQPNFMLEKGGMRGFQSNVKILLHGPKQLRCIYTILNLSTVRDGISSANEDMQCSSRKAPRKIPFGGGGPMH